MTSHYYFMYFNIILRKWLVIKECEMDAVRTHLSINSFYIFPPVSQLIMIRDYRNLL